MEERNLEQLLQWKQLQMLKLIEVSDLTEQLIQAAERNDNVSVRMLLSMRSDPLQQAAEIDETIRAYLLTLPEEHAIRGEQLMQGEAAAHPEEEALCAQIAKNRRLLSRCAEQDKTLSLRMGGNMSFYRKFRE